MSDAHDASAGPHRASRCSTLGAPLAAAQAAMILVHGRGATAEDHPRAGRGSWTPGVAYLAPQAAGNTGIRNSFLAPIAATSRGCRPALAVVGDLLAQVEAAGIPPERTCCSASRRAPA